MMKGSLMRLADRVTATVRGVKGNEKGVVFQLFPYNR